MKQKHSSGPIDPEIVVGVRGMAEVLGLSKQRVRRLVQMGLPMADSRAGLLWLRHGIEWYEQNIRDFHGSDFLRRQGIEARALALLEKFRLEGLED